MTHDRVAVRLIRDAGARARACGYTHLENPHPVGSWQYEAWFRGWAGTPIQTPTTGGTP